MTALTVNVLGTPVQQGSKTAGVTKAGKPYLRDANDKNLRPWRKLVDARFREAIRYSGWETLDAAAEVVLAFHHQRPAGHYGTGRNAGTLKPSAPTWKSTAPDIDKLTRAILDAATTSGALRDDARVARLIVEDRWADAAVGVRITITPLDTQTAASPPPVGDAARPDTAQPGGYPRCPATPTSDPGPAANSTPAAGPAHTSAQEVLL